MPGAGVRGQRRRLGQQVLHGAVDLLLVADPLAGRSERGGDVVDEIKKLKDDDGPDLQVHGSGELIQTLLQYDLVDEFWLKIFPVTLGMGKRLFDKGTIPAAYIVVDSKTSPSGVIVATLKRPGDIKTGPFWSKTVE